MKASSICGSDIRAIYREHLGVGDEAYRNVLAGHEPCGQIAEVGPGCKRFKAGDRVVLYHISGCGVCEDCQAGYMISCHSSFRAAYGWQRDGGHAPFLLAEENTCIALPDNLSYVDGALVACGFGTAWEALTRINVGGRDRLLVTGLGPVGLAAAMLGKALGASQVIGVDTSQGRIDLALELGLVDDAFLSDAGALEKIKAATAGKGCEASIDCSGAAPARKLALHGHAAVGPVRVRRRGRDHRLRRVALSDPSSDHAVRVLGDVAEPHGRLSGAPVTLGPAPGKDRHAPVQPGTRRRRRMTWPTRASRGKW